MTNPFACKLGSPTGAVSKGMLLFVVGVLALYLLPTVFTSDYGLGLMVLLFLSVTTGSAWNIIGGYTGQYSVGHAAYFGTGAYVTMLLLRYKEVPPWFGVWAAVVASVVVALVIGAICFRLRGPYFVLASIAVAEILRLVVLNWKDVTNGAEGVLVDVPPLKLGDTVVTDWITSKVPYYYIGLTLALATIAANYVVQHTKLGYYFQAIREDQDAAHSLGIHLYFHKTVALLISAVFTALAGALYAMYVQFIEPGTVLGVDLSVQIVLVCIIGGIGTILGPVVGALVLVPLSEGLRANLGNAHALIYGVLVVIVILFMPDGVLGFVRKLLTRRAVPPPAAVTPAPTPAKQ